MNKYLKGTLAVLVVFALSSIFHFIYAWLGEPIILAPFVPTNESIFAHFKLCVLPCIIGLYPFYRKQYSIGDMGLAGISTAVLMTLFYYFMVGGLGIHGLIPDLIILVIALFLSVPAMHIFKRVNSKASLAVTLAAIVAFGVLTFKHPDIPLFHDHNHAEEHVE